MPVIIFLLISKKTMKQKFINLLHELIILRLVKFFGIIIFCYLLIGIWKWRALPPQIPLFYSLPRSVDQLGTSLNLLILPILSLVFFMIDFIFAAIIFEKEKIAAQISVIIGTVSAFLLLITFVKIILLIT